ncbi:hypothetical protein MSIMFI_02069 [Mycobacterium simulans]|uniref:hypothetical protein n=1 Tax=Mycobacterium simulans TaxID=627089 RepID=UPI00174E56F5|nr:hypothetical protein [Mycobacterium simulans]SON60574.1 hypothetical protein MSIMFI_02069 [Mycobacterium simulans]
MTHQVATEHRSQRSRWRITSRPLLALAIGGSLGAALVAASSAQADTTDMTSPSFQLGYSKAVKDGQLTATRMRAEGFSVEHILVSSRIPTICAKEAATVATFPSLDRADFLRGCTEGMKSLVESGLAY